MKHTRKYRAQIAPPTGRTPEEALRRWGEGRSRLGSLWRGRSKRRPAIHQVGACYAASALSLGGFESEGAAQAAFDEAERRLGDLKRPARRSGIAWVRETSPGRWRAVIDVRVGRTPAEAMFNWLESAAALGERWAGRRGFLPAVRRIQHGRYKTSPLALGAFDTAEEAGEAYAEARRILERKGLMVRRPEAS